MTSILKADTIQDTDGNNIINENSNTITIGASGDTISIPSGATIANSGTATGFGETNTPYFQVSRQSSYQAVSATTDTTIQFNQVDLDTGSDWNSGTYKWTPEAGKYFFNARLTVDAGTIQGNFYIIYIRKNTTLLSQQIYRAYYNASFTLETSCVATANGSDTFDVQVYLQTGENIGYGARQSFFEGFKIAST